jgi:hypothetical protein
MALRNDYDLGVLNGTCMTVLYIDGHSHCMNCRTEQGEQRQIPFDYIADGHLAHAYAMTIHKAQGATFERALVLADDTMTAEHAYTALSRARECTDLFVETGDAIERESHAPVIESPVAERLRTSFGRTGSQSLAIDHDPTLVPIDVLRTERARLQATLVGRPIDHDRELRELQQKISSRRQSLEQAMWRQDQAQQRLDRLGPIGRHVHRHDRREFELREQSAAADINRLSEELACFTAEHRELSLEHREVTRWDEAHRPQLDRVGEIDRAIGLHDAAARALERGLTIERGPDRSMGLGL